MIEKFIVIDNCFSDPLSIIKYAEKVEFTTPRYNEKYTGLRSKELKCIDKDYCESLYNEIANHLVNPYYGRNLKIQYKSFTELFLHKLSKQDNKDIDSWWHCDDTVYSGVVYLNENAPKNSGTILELTTDNVICIDNVFNRLVMYKGDIIHRPECGFTVKNHDRLTLNIFTYGFAIECKYEGSVAELG